MPPLLDAVGFLLSKIPLVLKTALSHILGWSPTSQKWDLRTALTVTVLRDILCNSPPSTITEQQQNTMHDPGVKGNMWISRVTIPPSNTLKDVLCTAVRSLGTGAEEFSKPSAEPITAEWTGYRANASAKTPEPAIPEAEKFRCLMEEVKSDVTVLYFHGGSYYLMDPCTHRETVAEYAKLTQGRVLSVRYRLAPQSPFPAALLDALTVYLSLLYPPVNAFHNPVPPSHIVIAGDSAGGNLATALLQTILHLHRTASTVPFNNKHLSIPLPAGIALNSPSLDLTRSMHTTEIGRRYDYLPPPSLNPANSPPCTIWPADPPRADLFCEGNALCHPLISPILADTDWTGAPPIFISCGQELVTEECCFFAQSAARKGAVVVWEQYEAMPHCFAQILAGTRVSRRALESFTQFIQDVVSDPGSIATRGVFIQAKTLRSAAVDVRNIVDLDLEEVRRKAWSTRDKIVREFEGRKRR
ncbi:lipase/esterase [Aspergillus karnatakaensis]|uniref:alpha/beta hydrolase n=1 Tax=Aspergillus karnatakaensis TaxID=1810916 RepID=UPI003CCDB538